MLIVLGLDSLDYERLQTLDTPHLDSLEMLSKLETPAGLGPNELKTQVLWPSLLTGDHPKERFPQYFGTETEKISKWDNYVLDSPPVQWIEDILASTLSRQNKEQLKKLISGGDGRVSATAKAVRTESLYTDAKNADLISIPGVNEQPVNRDLKQMLDPSLQIEQGTTSTNFEQFAITADMRRLIETLESIESHNHNLIMTHFFSLDLVQHLWAADHKKMERWYGIYDDIVGRVLSEIEADDTLVIVSDHGMQKQGIHSKQATFGATKDIWNNKKNWTEFREIISSELLDHNTEESENNDETISVHGETKDHLEDLGYF